MCICAILTCIFEYNTYQKNQNSNTPTAIEKPEIPAIAPQQSDIDKRQDIIAKEQQQQEAEKQRIAELRKQEETARNSETENNQEPRIAGLTNQFTFPVTLPPYSRLAKINVIDPVTYESVGIRSYELRGSTIVVTTTEEFRPEKKLTCNYYCEKAQAYVPQNPGYFRPAPVYVRPAPVYGQHPARFYRHNHH
jgi:hypothetical protein